MLILLSIAIYFIKIGLNDEYYSIFFILFIASLLPLLYHINNTIKSFIRPNQYGMLFIQTVDSILNIELFNNMLKSTFDDILKQIKTNAGLLIFYYQDNNEFRIFHQRNKKRKYIQDSKIENDNILFKVINTPKDILIKEKLNPSKYIEKQIIDELERLYGEIVIPIYYQNIFLGIIIIGEKKRDKNFTASEIRLLKTLASSIAILSVNSLFFKDILRKKEFEKEYDLATKVQKKFLPDADLKYGKIEVTVYHNTPSQMYREFYDIVQNDNANYKLRISAYKIQSDIKGISIFMPGIQAVLQTLASLSFSPSQCVSRLQHQIKVKNLIDEDMVIFQSTITQNGTFTFYNTGYPSPIIYKKSLKSLYSLNEQKSNKKEDLNLEPGDILIISCESFFRLINTNISQYFDIINNHSNEPLNKMKSILVNNLTKILDENDKLLILIRMEDAP